jgi:predicted regulator of Ras-like GTPase activity (Roadblock/LC7/MglB family)
MSPFDAALAGLSRIPGVRSALIVSAEDGLVIGEASMIGVEAPAVAALAASLMARLTGLAEAAGHRAVRMAHLEALGGGLVAMPVGSGMLLVAVIEPEANVGLLRLALRAAAERLE